MGIWMTTAGFCLLPVALLVGYWVVATALGIED